MLQKWLTYVQFPQRTEENKSAETGITDIWETPCGCRELSTSLLQVKLVLLKTWPFSSPDLCYYYYNEKIYNTGQGDNRSLWLSLTMFFLQKLRLWLASWGAAVTKSKAWSLTFLIWPELSVMLHTKPRCHFLLYTKEGELVSLLFDITAPSFLHVYKFFHENQLWKWICLSV